MPAQASDPSAALRLADTHLYTAKAAFHAQHRGGRGGRGGRGDIARAQVPVALANRLPALSDHLDRVVGVAVTCAEEFGLPADQVLTIEPAAQLHDIGKVAIPAAILAKRGDLTDEEQEFMRRHSLIGERLLRGSASLDQVAAMVRTVQERWDGGGYPDQLTGDSIPIGARIIAVANAFCAMTTDRAHAPARSTADALTEIDRCAGTQFDPAVVAVVAEVVTRAPLVPA